MLLKTIARKTLELKNHKIDKIKETPEGKIEIYISPKKRLLLPCKNQVGKYKVVDRLPERRWKHVSLWGREVEIIYSPCRVLSKGKLVVEDIPWSMGRKRGRFTSQMSTTLKKNGLYGLERVAIKTR